MTSWRGQGDSQGKPDRRERNSKNKGTVFGTAGPREVTLIEFGRHGSNLVFINSLALWISCEV